MPVGSFKTVSPELTIARIICDYPSLYAKVDYQTSRLSVFDDLFNGLSGSQKERFREVYRNSKPQDIEEAQRYITEDLYYGYTKILVSKTGIVRPDTSDMSIVVVKESDKNNHPEVKLWIKISKPQGPWVPYPNFHKQYSFVYSKLFNHFPIEWVETAIWYYEQAKQFFLVMPEYYHYAYPSNNQSKDVGLLRNLSERLKDYASEEAFSAAYEVEYTGDMDDFARRRWDKEKKRCLDFIDQTISYLNKRIDKHKKLG